MAEIALLSTCDKKQMEFELLSDSKLLLTIFRLYPHVQKHANREGYPRRKFYFGRKNGLSRGNFCSAAQEIVEFFVLILVVSLEKFEYIELESLTAFITKSLLGH